MQIIHHLDELLAALQAGERELCTPPNALGYLGAGYIGAMVAEARASYPDFVLWADAGSDAGAAMAGLRTGLSHICIEAPEAVRVKLQQMAAQTGAKIVLRNR